jgi:hypothetical protein
MVAEAPLSPQKQSYADQDVETHSRLFFESRSVSLIPWSSGADNEINSALVDPRMKARFAELGGTVLFRITRRLRQAYRRGHCVVGTHSPKRRNGK